MDAIKKNIAIVLLLLFFTPFVMLSQKNKYPKDTIYVKYVNKVGDKKILNWNYKGNYGIYFSIKEGNGKHISLFYPKEKPADTLCNLHLKDYKFSDLKEINSKEWRWYKKKFGGQPPFGNKNGVFETYLVEIISKDYFVIYPVVWRNEGVID